MKAIFYISFTTCLLVLAPFILGAATITSATSGAWSSTTTWVGGQVPTAADDAFINPQHTVSVQGATNTVAASITVQPGGTLTYLGTLGTSSFLTNNGMVRINAQAPVTFSGGLNNIALFLCEGASNVTVSGTINQAASGTIDAATGTMVTLQGTLNNFGRVAGQGTIVFNGLSYDPNGASHQLGNGNGTLEFRGANTLQASFSQPVISLNMEFANVNFQLNSSFQGLPSAQLILPAASQMYLVHTSTLSGWAVFLNQGMITQQNGAWNLRCPVLNQGFFNWNVGIVTSIPGVVFTNTASGVITCGIRQGSFGAELSNLGLVTSGGDINLGVQFTNPVTNQGGTFRLNNGGIFRFTASMINTGTITRGPNSTLDMAGAFSHQSTTPISGPGQAFFYDANSVITGTGTFSGGPVKGSMNGLMDPGLPNMVGRLTTDNLEFSQGSGLHIDVEGPGAGTGHDQIVVNGSLFANGRLSFDFSGAPANAFSAGDRITFITGATSISRNFFDQGGYDRQTWVLQYNDPSPGDISLVNISAPPTVDRVRNVNLATNYPTITAALADQAISTDRNAPHTLIIDPTGGPFPESPDFSPFSVIVTIGTF